MSEVFLTEQGQFIIARPDEHTLKDSFERFDRENPHVYEHLVRLARLWRDRRGESSRCGMKMLWEVMRWDLATSTVGEPLKLNNNYHSFYAREIMAREQDLDGIFETRRSS